MPFGNYQTGAQCPFFRFADSKRHRITCEGLVDDSCLALIYQDRQDYRIQVSTYCCRHYEKCEVYRMLASKYEEESI